MISIRDIRVILTRPMGRNLLVVKVETSEPGLYGLGCGTFTQRFRAVKSAVEDDLKPLLIGRDVSRIEELWRLMMFNGYWRGGPVLNNAVGGVDMALWDIKAKIAGLPLVDLLGGRVREAAAVYQHADGRDHAELGGHIERLLAQNIRHVRVRLGGGAAETRASGEAGGMAYGGVGATTPPPDGALGGAYFDPGTYARSTLGALEYVRETFGDGVELLHDVHERLNPVQALGFAKDVERFRLFFLEDPLPLEQIGWHERLRAATTTPIAASELFTQPSEWLPLVSGRLIDFLRMHLSHLGGLTPARKATVTAESFGVRTAWHGPGDCSPVGHAVGLHLELASPNFGVHELQPFVDAAPEVFPGCPELRDGYLYPNDKPGHGVDLDEALAAKYPVEPSVVQWTQARLPDGTLSPP